MAFKGLFYITKYNEIDMYQLGCKYHHIFKGVIKYIFTYIFLLEHAQHIFETKVHIGKL